MTHRYPFAPLARAMGVSEHQAAIRLGISGSTEQLYRREGMSEKVADRMAVKAGLHPFEVWPEIVEHVEQARLERRRQVARDSARKRYREDAEVRARRKASAAAARAANKRAARFQPSRQPEVRRAAGRRFYSHHAERLAAEARKRYWSDTAYRARKNAADRAAYERRKTQEAA